MDERLRKLGREAESGDQEARERLLPEEIRAGKVPGWKLDVGCALGDPFCLDHRGFPLTHSEPLSQLFDLLCANSPARTVYVFLRAALTSWERHRALAEINIDGAEPLRVLLREIDNHNRVGYGVSTVLSRAFREFDRATLVMTEYLTLRSIGAARCCGGG